MRVFLDTNVLVSGFATRGLSADVGRLVLAEHDLVTAEPVLQELRQVLTEKFGVPTDVAGEIEALLRQSHVEPMPTHPRPVDVRDPDDAVVLGAALASGADALVTGDRDLLDVAERVEDLQILTPRQLWERIRSG